MSDKLFTRREGLGLAAAALGAVAAPTGVLAAAPRLRTKIDFRDPIWNRDTYARIDGDVDMTKVKCGWLKGKAFGVRENEKVRPLFGVEGFSFTRMKRLEDGSWRRLLREIVFYRDIETGAILTSWQNPYTNERVRVVPIANDPFNFTISDYYPDPPDYGGLQTEKRPRRPFLQEWSHGPNGTLVLHTGIDMIYPNALQPDKWPRESGGVMNRVSEHFIYTMKAADVENPRITHIPYVGAWSRITPWLPWMLMGQAPGHISYFTSFQTLPRGERDLPRDLVAAARAMGEKWMDAPETDYGPSLSSLENYAREQQPAPVPPGWAPPQPPARITRLGPPPRT